MRRNDTLQNSHAMWNERPVIVGGILLGIGLGGFLDGIVLHQLLQWHSMLSSVRPEMDVAAVRENMFWDGVFHAFAWVMTVLGVARLWAGTHGPGVAWSGRALVGSACIGWGLFNFVEGIVDHQLLGLHHVHRGPGQFAWDLGFLAFGLLLMVGGALALRSEETLLGTPAYR